MHTKRVYIFANGEIPNLRNAKAILDANRYIIAADGGSQHLQEMDIIPDMLIGDLDSIQPDYLKELIAKNVEIKQYPVAKDLTDLEIAIQRAKDLNPEQIVIVGAMGGRFDHALANVLLLAKYSQPGLLITLDDGCVQVMVIKEKHTIHGNAGDLVSLIPIEDRVSGISTEGLKYPLDDAVLTMGESRGISNVMLEGTANVSIKSGVLVCIHTRVENGGIK